MRFAAIGLVVVTLAAAVGLAPTGNAAVRKPAPLRLSCDPYIRFEQRCHCGGAQGYFLGYGRKYCERSLAETGWSPAGARWRDRTLLCLQRALSAAMPKERAQHCDCQALRNYAFESHVSCYTQPPTSICHLPVTDWLLALRVIDAADLLSPAGSRQVGSVMQVCLQQ